MEGNKQLLSLMQKEEERHHLSSLLLKVERLGRSQKTKAVTNPTKQLLLLNVLWDILLLKSQTKQKSFLQSSKGDNNTPR
jgi:hypothetical protein